MQITYGNAPNAVAPLSQYSAFAEVQDAKRWLFVSGQTPQNEKGEAPSIFLDQATMVWENVMAQLAAADMSAKNLVKVTIFLSDRKYAMENREVRERFLAKCPCALTVIITGIFDSEWLLEIEAVAAA